MQEAGDTRRVVCDDNPTTIIFYTYIISRAIPLLWLARPRYSAVPCGYMPVTTAFPTCRHTMPTG